MQDTQLNRISNFLWSVSDDLLRDLYVRGKYRDVILPMTVLRRSRRRPRTHQAEGPQREDSSSTTTASLNKTACFNRRPSHAFYNTSPVHDARPGGPRRPAVATR